MDSPSVAGSLSVSTAGLRVFADAARAQVAQMSFTLDAYAARLGAVAQQWQGLTAEAFFGQQQQWQSKMCRRVNELAAISKAAEDMAGGFDEASRKVAALWGGGLHG